MTPNTLRDMPFSAPGEGSGEPRPESVLDVDAVNDTAAETSASGGDRAADASSEQPGTESSASAENAAEGQETASAEGDDGGDADKGETADTSAAAAAAAETPDPIKVALRAAADALDIPADADEAKLPEMIAARKDEIAAEKQRTSAAQEAETARLSAEREAKVQESLKAQAASDMLKFIDPIAVASLRAKVGTATLADGSVVSLLDVPDWHKPETWADPSTAQGLMQMLAAERQTASQSPDIQRLFNDTLSTLKTQHAEREAKFQDVRPIIDELQQHGVGAAAQDRLAGLAADAIRAVTQKQTAQIETLNSSLTAAQARIAELEAAAERRYQEGVVKGKTDVLTAKEAGAKAPPVGSGAPATDFQTTYQPKSHISLNDPRFAS